MSGRDGFELSPSRSDVPLRIALTGGSGFVGKSVAEQLLAAGHQLRALRHRAPLTADPRIEAVLGSLEDRDALNALVKDCDAVIHLAGLTAARSAAEFHRVNAEGTRQLAAAAREAGVPRFLLISSLAAREPALSPYASSKRAGEIALAETPDLAWDIFRPPAIYGAEDQALLQLLKPLKHGLALLPAGRAARASVIHVEDLASAVLAWLALPQPNGATYELDDGTAGGYRWEALLAQAAQALGVSPYYVTPPAMLLNAYGLLSEAYGKIRRKPSFLSLGKLREMRHPDWTADSTPFTEISGRQPRIAFEEGITATIAEYRRKGWL